MKQLTTDRACVLVFAKISASISHEIKNTLSIINENAGLLEDFAQMADEGGGVAVERVLSVTKTIAKQVDRSNTIMKNLNRFAHSADTSLAHGNLEETLMVMVALTSRQAAMKNITTTLSCPPDINLSTYLISFESLIYLTLLTLFQNSIEGSTIAIEAKEEASDIILCFNIEPKDDLALRDYPDDDQKLLAELVKASSRCEKNRLILTLPAVVQSGKSHRK
jgi:nitrogen fixation/metabolism regulation signal transduction histidine kinase